MQSGTVSRIDIILGINDKTRKSMAELSCLNLKNFFKTGKPLHEII